MTPAPAAVAESINIVAVDDKIYRIILSGIGLSAIYLLIISGGLSFE